ncbi:MAG: cupin domain-containing protein [Acidimicrobiia bacterium]|nr:cupin domain-containing protein [Acidimicrobiia bacterium]
MAEERAPSPATRPEGAGRAHPARRAHDAPGGGQRWSEVEVHEYKAEGEAPFREVTRQVLFDDPDLACQVRYFEVAPGGWSTLERHEHVHAVVVLRGRGMALVDGTVFDVGLNDLVSVGPMAWHQFRAGADEPLGFLCVVNHERDRPQLPSEADLAALRVDPTVAAFLAS